MYFRFVSPLAFPTTPSPSCSLPLSIFTTSLNRVPADARVCFCMPLCVSTSPPLCN